MLLLGEGTHFHLKPNPHKGYAGSFCNLPFSMLKNHLITPYILEIKERGSPDMLL